MEEKKFKAVFYARVSTEEEEQLHAIEKQIEENREIISAKGWILVDEYIDKGITGTQAKKRDQYMRLLEDIPKNKFDVIVVKDQSRLQRNTMDWYIFLNELIQHQKRLYLYLENTFFDPKDKFIFGIKAMMAEEYSRDLSKKSNAAKRRRQEKGKPIITNRTWGFKNLNGKIIIDDEEAKIIRLIYKLFSEGYGGRTVSRILMEEGIRNHNGKTLSENTIRDIIKNPLYKGIAVMNKEHFDFEAKKIVKNPKCEWIYRNGIVPQIIQEDLWERANAQINRRKKTNNVRPIGINKGNSLLSSKIICGECGSTFWRNKRAQGVYWYCSEGSRSRKINTQTSKKCMSLNLKEEILFPQLEQLASNFISKETAEEILCRALQKIYTAIIGSRKCDTIEETQLQIAKMTKRKEALMDLLLDGTIDKADYLLKLEAIRNQIKYLYEKKEDMQKRKEENDKLWIRLNTVRTLFKNKTEKNISIPLICSHITQIKVYQKHLDVYLDLLQDSVFLSIDYCRKNSRKIYDMPICPGIPISGGCESHSGSRA